ncbi:Bor family protein [Olivibacter sitiensis]|uniref:Bor family protein n=1 Tax=Olivibacter sitiensis TaxID=376470 RepID=UPI0004840C7E|nr:Bor family protein [Olivibacter sitiensis]
MKSLQKGILLITTCVLLSSCYSYTAVVGKGPQTNQKASKWNHYAVYGLAPISVVDSKELVGDAKDYSINITHTFINGLVSGLTFGLYNPTTVTVTK